MFEESSLIMGGFTTMETLLFEQEGNIARVTLHRPEAMNAFNYNMLSELGQVIESIRINPDIRVVIFTGAGDRAFSVGADLKERRQLTDSQVKRNIYKIGEVFTMVENLPQPTIAVLNGYAFGGGMELALACDFRFAADSAVMGLTETGLAIIPGAGGTQRLPRLIGEAKAMELILTARRLKAEEAYMYGMLTSFAPTDTVAGNGEPFYRVTTRKWTNCFATGEIRNQTWYEYRFANRTCN